MDNMMSLFLEDYPIVSNVMFFTLVMLFLKWNEASFRRDRRRNHCRAYQRNGVLCGGVVIDRKVIGDKQYIRYAYRLGTNLDTAYIKDFVEAPEELKEHHKNILVVLFPRYSRSGIHYGVLQKLMTSKGVVARNGADMMIGYKAFLRLCLLQGVMMLWASLGTYFFWTYHILLYVSLYQIWQIHKTEEEATGVVEGVWKTLKRNGSRPKRSWFVQSDELDGDSIEDIFLALEKSECRLAQIMESFDPGSKIYGTAFPWGKYGSLASRQMSTSVAKGNCHV